MNGDKNFFQNQIVSKKMQKIDEDESHRTKKGKKNKKSKCHQTNVDTE